MLEQYKNNTQMKWISYIAAWVYALLVTGYGFASIYNPDNEAAVITGRIPTDIFTVIGLISLYFVYASTKQNFRKEAREKKRFDLLIISVLNIVVLIIPIVFLAIFLSKTLGQSSFVEETNYMTTIIGFSSIFVLILFTFYFNVKMFVYNK